ncbi:MAG TPA: lipoprotein-releasing ABC transporter permease subunit [Acidiferrobacterales bacterium]|nr:lipoprotein-releasing ABC transporter permease subunit [Acidiferrobacterales bacterium]
MIRPFEFLIGLRYTRAKRRNHFISFISFSSMSGIALGVTALITVLSVMNGFEKELRSRILGVASHITITGPGERLQDWRAVSKQVQQNHQVVGKAPYIMGQGMLARGKAVSGVLVRGILPAEEPQVSDLGKNMVIGKLADLRAHAFGIILGRELAWKLDADVGTQVSLIIPQGQVTPAGLLPRLKRFTVVGIFEIGMFEYDSGLVLMHIEDAAKLYQMGDEVTGLRLKVDDIYRAPFIGHEIETRLDADYRVRDWSREHANFFRALKIEKTVMFVILLLIVAVAAFNIISTLVMVVTDKRSDIAILRTLGVSPASIMGIFMVQGSIIGVIGTALGVIGGIALALNVETVVPFLERLFNTTFLAADVYYISELPSDMRWADVIRIAAVSLGISLLATIYPAWRAAQTQPAEALRYE